jgi:hypothetical protein
VDAPSSFLPDLGQDDRGAALEKSFEHASGGLLQRPFLSFFRLKKESATTYAGDFPSLSISGVAPEYRWLENRSGFHADGAPTAAIQKSIEITFSADRNQLFSAWNAIANLADLAGKVNVTVRADSVTGFEPGKLQNGVLEPLRESDLIN